MKEVRVCEAMKSPVGGFKRRNGLASARWRDQVPTSSDLGKEQSDAGRSCGLLWHWHQQAAFIIG